MAIFNSDQVANLLANPPVATEVTMHGARLRCSSGFFAHTTGGTGDEIILCTLPSNARVISIRIECAGGSAAGNLGVYSTAGIVQDVDCFATAASLTSISTDHRWEAASNELLIEEKMWENAELASDPGGLLAIGIKPTADCGASTAYNIMYVVD